MICYVSTFICIVAVTNTFKKLNSINDTLHDPLRFLRGFCFGKNFKD